MARISKTEDHIEKLKEKTNSFKQEFKKETAVAITAAFAFLIALVWRDWISSLINTNKVSFLSAIFITALCVLGLMAVSKWNSSPEEKVI